MANVKMVLFIQICIIYITTSISTTILTPSTANNQYLRLSFDGGSRGIHEMGYGGAILHLCDNDIDQVPCSDKSLTIPPYNEINKAPFSDNTVQTPSPYNDMNKPLYSGKSFTATSVIWKGSYWFGYNTNSHLAEYLALIEGLYACKNIFNFKKTGLHEHLSNTNNENDFELDQIVADRKVDDSYNDNNESDIKSNILYIQGDSKIVINNLIKKFLPKDRKLRAAHVTAAALLDSLISYTDLSEYPYTDIPEYPYPDGIATFLQNSLNYIGNPDNPVIPEYSDTGVLIKSIDTTSTNNYNGNESNNGNSKDYVSGKIENKMKEFVFSFVNGYNLSHVYREYNVDADALGNIAI
jgi:hypothetical protein